MLQREDVQPAATEGVNRLGPQLAEALAQPPSWNLEDLYSGLAAPERAEDQALLKVRSHAFRKAFRGRVASLELDEVPEVLAELESLYTQLTCFINYAALSFAANTQDPQVQQAWDQAQAFAAEIENNLLFFSLDLQALPQVQLEAWRDAPELANYRHYFDHLAHLAPHRLRESVEQTRNRDLLTGREAFVQLRTVHLGEQHYPPVTSSEGQTVQGEAELSALLFTGDRATRHAAYRSTRVPHQQHNTLYAYILGAIAQDHALETELRDYDSTLARQLLADQVPPAVFQAVMDGTRDHAHLWQRYYRLKAQAIGHPLTSADIYAPWSSQPVAPLGYREGVAHLLAALARFDAGYAQRAEAFFQRPWIDAVGRPGKRGGAFCSSSPGKHSYLFLTYTNDYHSLFTLAHELGHGLHFSYINDHQTYFNSQPPLVLAEVASLFNELLLLDYLLAQTSGAGSQQRHLTQTLLTLQLETQLSLLFRQTTISRLEVALHDRAATGRFEAEFVNQTWQDLYTELCGEAVELLPEHRYDWSRIGHLFFKPFYCYQYAASAIVSLACYQQYLQQGKDFLPGYFDLLSLGGSEEQISALQRYVGVDLTEPEAIAGALAYVERAIDQLATTL